MGYIPPPPPKVSKHTPKYDKTDYRSMINGEYFCGYCGSGWHENRFHPGTCDNCGGPKNETEYSNPEADMLEVTSFGDSEPVFIPSLPNPPEPSRVYV